VQQPLQLYTERNGSGPPILFAHGFGGSARNFRKQARALSDAFTVVSYDARGHARSPSPEEPDAYAPECLFDDFGHMLASAGKDAVAAGLSMGAYTALSHALRAAEPPKALVLASYPSPKTNPKRVRWAEGFADAIETRGLDAAGAEYVWGEDSRFDASSAAFIRQGFLEHRPHALAALLRRVIARIPHPDELASELARLSVPTLIVAGAEDAEAIEPSESLAKHLPNASLIVLEGAGHLVNLQAADAFNARLREFLAR